MNDINFSIIIPVSRKDSAEKIIQLIKMNNYPQDKLEIILIDGKENPSRKRNKGAMFSSGEYLVFMDDDIEIDKYYFRKLQHILLQNKFDVVGGPNCGHSNENKIEKIIDIAFGSKFGFGKGANRFKKNNKIISGTEDNLTLCSLCIRKSTFIKEKGFDETLFPGEEVDLISRLRSSGYKMSYNPDISVIHHRRSSLKALAMQMYYYGKGRIDLFAKNGFHIKNIVYISPLIMLIYTLLLPFEILLYPFLMLIFIIYFIGLVMCCLSNSISKKITIKDWILLIIVLITIHYSYGLGMLIRIKDKGRCLYNASNHIMWRKKY